jgi:Nucleotidyl transferase AbiEii toxin, Type IV TA system
MEVSLFDPKIEILPLSQRKLWNELGQTPRHFVLYGGTALALRLGHRQSEDFDFFSNQSFEPSTLIRGVGYLKHARVDQRGDNTLTVVAERGGPVRLSFFGDLHMAHVFEPDLAPDNGLQVASLLDLSATKLRTIQQRAEAKDYRDIDAALASGINLAEGLAAGVAIYGKAFNPLATLKALTYFKDGNLPSLPGEIQERLLKAATVIKLDELPQVAAKPGIARPQKTP